MKSSLRDRVKNVVLSKANPHAFCDTDDEQQPAITILKIKRPMKGGHRAGEETDPIKQAFGYLERIRGGGVLDKTGRDIPNAVTIPAQVYVIVGLKPSLKKRCEYAGFKATPGGMSHFGFNDSPKVRAYTEVVSFGGLLTHATQINSAFFEQLGLPSSQ